MSEISDETLMSYIDGELDWAERRTVESAIHRQPDLQNRLRVFAATGLNLQRLYSQPMQEAVPEHLLRFVLEAPMSESIKGRRATRAAAGGFFEALKEALMPGGFRPAVAYAFSAVLVVGVASGLFMSRMMHSAQPERVTVASSTNDTPSIPSTPGMSMVSYNNGAITAQGELARALETTPMDVATSWPIGGNQEATFKTKFTFMDNRHQYCRQYEISQGADAGSAGVACRNGQGQWEIEHNVFDVDKEGGVAVKMAGGKFRGPLQAIDSVVDKMIVGNVLSRGDETTKIKVKWDRPATK
jgi:hypothetical protein